MGDIFVKKIRGEYNFIGSARRAGILLALHGKIECIDIDTRERIMLYSNKNTNDSEISSIKRKKRYKNRK